MTTLITAAKETRCEKVRLIQFLHESSARSPESGLYSDWPKISRALGASLRLVTELQIILLENRLTADEIMAAEKDLNTSDV